MKSGKALRVLRSLCTKKKSLLIPIRQNTVHLRQSSLDGLHVDFCIGKKKFKNVHVALAGKHQASNALLAVQAIEVAAQLGTVVAGEQAIREGLVHIQRYSGIQARLSVIRDHPLVLADVAHNPDAMRILCASVKELHLGKMHIVFGLMQDKNYAAIISELKHIAHRISTVEAKTERSRNSTLNWHPSYAGRG